MSPPVQASFMRVEGNVPVYTQLLKCATCYLDIGTASPHDAEPEGRKYAVIREHRRLHGCPKGHPALVIATCSLCPNKVVATTNTSLKGGAWWVEVGRPHDQFHGIERAGVRARTSAAVHSEPPPAALQAAPPSAVGTERTAHCRSCQAEIVFRLSASGKWCPLDVVDGVVTGRSHFATCPERAKWRRS